MPVWLTLIAMSLTSYRLTRLIVKDDFPPVLWLRDRFAGGWRDLTSTEQRMLFGGVLPGGKAVEMRKIWSVNTEGDQRYVYRLNHVPDWFAKLITCAWCASAYVAGAVTAVTDLTVGLPAPWLAGVAVWGAAALLASREWA